MKSKKFFVFDVRVKHTGCKMVKRSSRKHKVLNKVQFYRCTLFCTRIRPTVFKALRKYITHDPLVTAAGLDDSYPALKFDRHSDESAMAAAGGGDFRSRRYYAAAKPYAKNKQVNSLADFMV